MVLCVTELPDQCPQVVVELANTVAYEGTVGRFRCKFHGQPEPLVKWYDALLLCTLTRHTTVNVTITTVYYTLTTTVTALLLLRLCVISVKC